MDALSFEDAFAQLEQAVTQLQDGKMPLEKALHLYQEGMELAQYCNELLQKAELTVEQLRVAADGTLSVEPLEL